MKEGGQAKQSYGESSEMITGKGTHYSWGSPRKLMGETENPVTDEVEMEMLPEQKFSMTKKKEKNKGDCVEGQLHRHGWPARDTFGIAERVPIRPANDAEATAVQQTADAAQTDADRCDEGEVVSRRSAISDMSLGQFDKDVAAEQRAQDRFPGRELQPHVRRAEMQPAFGQYINELRAEECADQGCAIDEKEPLILASAVFPKHEADRDTCQ